LLLTSDEDDDESVGSVGSLVDFVVDDDVIVYRRNGLNASSSTSSSSHMHSDEEYDVRQDIMELRRAANTNHNRNRKRKRYASFDSNGDLLSEDEDDEDYDFDGDLNESFSSLLNVDNADRAGNSNYNSMVMDEPPNRKRKGTRTVCEILPLCRYGKACYRKNLQHFAEFAHPWSDQSIQKEH